MKPSVHPLATSHQPSFITASGDTDILMVVAITVLASAVLALVLLSVLQALQFAAAIRDDEIAV